MEFFPIAKSILKSMFIRPVTTTFPNVPYKTDPLVRGHVDNDIEKCIFCGICEKRCPTDAISVNKAGKVWEISRFNCIVCNCCVEVCPKKCLHMRPELTPASAEKIIEVERGARVPADA